VSQPFPLLSERLSGSPLLRQIADDAGETALAFQHDFAHRQIDGDTVSVAVFGLQLAANADDSSLAGFHVAPHVFIVAATMRLRHEPVHGLAGDLLGRVPEQLGGRLVERLYATLVIDDDDCVRRGLQNGAVLGFPPRMLGAVDNDAQ
jgi:hypothetical protein